MNTQPNDLWEELHSHLQQIYKHGWEQKGDQWEMVNQAEKLIETNTSQAVETTLREFAATLRAVFVNDPNLINADILAGKAIDRTLEATLTTSKKEKE